MILRKCGVIEICVFWCFTQRRMVVSYRRFRTTCRSHIQGSSSPTTILYCVKSQNSAHLVCTATESYTHARYRPNCMKCTEVARDRDRRTGRRPGFFRSMKEENFLATSITVSSLRKIRHLGTKRI